MSFYRQNYLGFNISHFGTALPCATGPPAAARPRQVHPTRQTKVYGERTGPNAKLGAGTVARSPPEEGLLGPLESSGRRGYTLIVNVGVWLWCLQPTTRPEPEL